MYATEIPKIDGRHSLHTLANHMASFARSEFGSWAGHYMHADHTASVCLRISNGLSRFAADCPQGYKPRKLQPTYHDMDTNDILTEARLDCELLLDPARHDIPHALVQDTRSLLASILAVGAKFYGWAG